MPCIDLTPSHATPTVVVEDAGTAGLGEQTLGINASAGKVIIGVTGFEKTSGSGVNAATFVRNYPDGSGGWVVVAKSGDGSNDCNYTAHVVEIAE